MERRRYSQQRERIYQAVMASKEHPTAQMVYDGLRQELPQLSLGTVYRMARFDGVLQPHSHIRCDCCGALADAAPAYDAALDQGRVAAGWTVRGHDLVFHGVCPACAEKR